MWAFLWCFVSIFHFMTSGPLLKYTQDIGLWYMKEGSSYCSTESKRGLSIKAGCIKPLMLVFLTSYLKTNMYDSLVYSELQL